MRLGEGEEVGTDGGCVTGVKSENPADEEAGTLLRLGDKGERLACPGVVTTFLLRAGEGAKDGQGWLLEWLCAEG